MLIGQDRNIQAANQYSMFNDDQDQNKFSKINKSIFNCQRFPPVVIWKLMHCLLNIFFLII